MRKVAEKTLVAEELMRLYEELPDLVMYKNDLLSVEKTQYIEEISGLSDNENLNPLDVVLESLINILSEKLSIDTLTQSKSTAYVDKSMQELAVQKIISLARDDVSFLEKMHKKWLEGLHNFMLRLKEKGVYTLEEAIFQVSLRFRISASSSLKALVSLMR